MEDEPESNYYYNSTEEEEDEDDIHVPLRKLERFHIFLLNLYFIDETSYRASQQDFKLWDSFQDPPQDESSGSSIDSEFIETLTKLMKIVTYWLVFIVVAFSAVVSKLSFLLMTSHVAENSKTPYCDISSESTSKLSLKRQSMFNFHYQYQRRNSKPWFHRNKFLHGNGRLWSRSRCLKSAHSLNRFGFGFLRRSKTLRGKTLELCFSPSPCTSPAYVCSPLKFFQNSTSSKEQCWPTVYVLCLQYYVSKKIIPPLINWFICCHLHKAMLSRSSAEPKRKIKFVLDIGSISVQLIGFFIWPLTVTSARNIWFIPISLFLISLHWWENFVTKCSPLGKVFSLFIDSWFINLHFS